MSERFGEVRHFVWFVAGVASVTVIAAAILDPAIPSQNALLPFAVALLALTAYALYRTDNHGRGRTLRSRAQRVAARAFVGPIKPCGCWGDEDADSVELDHYVDRSDEGGRVRFEARKRILKRCYGCGRHYHVDHSAKLKRVGDTGAILDAGDTERGRGLSLARHVDVWPEDEPKAREAIDAPIEEQTTADEWIDA